MEAPGARFALLPIMRLRSSLLPSLATAVITLATVGCVESGGSDPCTRTSCDVAEEDKGDSGTATALIAIRSSLVNAKRVTQSPSAITAIAGVPVRGVTQTYVDVETWMPKSALITNAGEVGPLTAEQFRALTNAFGGQTRLKYKPSRNYQLADFLPPALQALVYRDLEVKKPIALADSEAIGGELGLDERKKVGHTANCHGTSWLAVRALAGEQQATAEVFFGDPLLMDERLNSTLFTTVQSLAADEVARLPELELRVGDVVAFFAVSDRITLTDLAHTAVYVGGGLFFEKPNTEATFDETPYRLATAAQVAAPVAEALAGSYRVAIYRAAQPLPSGAAAFATEREPEFAALALRKNKALGVDLVSEFETGGNGAILRETFNAVWNLKLTDDTLGRTKGK